MKPLPDRPKVAPGRRRALGRLFERTRTDPPADLAAVIRDELGVDLSTTYGPFPVPHPFGKASGQLSCTLPQVRDDVNSGIAFIVLKTVIAEAPDKSRAMEGWATPETKMRVEGITSHSGNPGWTVTWTGRGWQGSLDEYLEFFDNAVGLEGGADVPIIPSVKFHLPIDDEYRMAEYEYTILSLRHTCLQHRSGLMPIEKDFSPTLAGDSLAQDRATVLGWLREVPHLMRKVDPDGLCVFIKMMNAVEDDGFQLEMLEAVLDGADRPDGLVVFNRLFDQEKQIAYGGFDLSDRNLRVLDAARAAGLKFPPLSATGNICSGRMMFEYARRGCENGQLHTFFQLPNREYTASGGARTARALHTLLLHPTSGLVSWMYHAAEAKEIDEVGGELRFVDVVRRGW